MPPGYSGNFGDAAIGSRNLKRGFTGAAFGPARIPKQALHDYTEP
jgi:hypothetical protein